MEEKRREREKGMEGVWGVGVTPRGGGDGETPIPSGGGKDRGGHWTPEEEGEGAAKPPPP